MQLNLGLQEEGGCIRRLSRVPFGGAHGVLASFRTPVACHLSHLSPWLSPNQHRAEAVLKQHLHELWSPLEERLCTYKRAVWLIRAPWPSSSWTWASWPWKHGVAYPWDRHLGQGSHPDPAVMLRNRLT